ncbi:hypothetical protein [uncultured Modestobacter sp.]|uniref:hypothetical protein n=1 Tax=uncultured Modestobacter sp. TaxID=380048 RepID=UPI00260C2CF0|nr:hypothetical protein [uncultured Modestobacter sp.]
MTESREPKLPEADISPAVALTEAAVTDAINKAMAAPPTLSGWVVEARSELIARGDEFTRSLGVTAVQFARDRHATVVDVEDVRTAARSLSEPPDAWSAWLLAIASLLGGAAIAAFVTILAAAEPPPLREIWYGVIALLSVTTGVLLYRARPKNGK